MVIRHLEILQRKCIVLASASPRRVELLKAAGLSVHVHPSGAMEDLPKNEFKCGGDYALSTAKLKAEHALKQLVGAVENEKGTTQGDSGKGISFDLLIAADTVAALPAAGSGGGIEILEKPSTAKEAADMMRRLSGKSHQMWTGVVIVVASKDKDENLGCESGSLRWFEMKTDSTVQFAILSEDDISTYVGCRENWEGKAGGYGIQDAPAHMICSVEGDYHNVMGLPLQAVCDMLDRLVDNGIIPSD